MTAPCAPFAVEEYKGRHWVTRDGTRKRVAPPEVVMLWQRRPEALVTLCELAIGDGGSLTVWSIEGDGWQDDAAMLRQAAEALAARARAIESKAA